MPHEYTCPQCGSKFFDDISQRRIYCSRACHNRARPGPFAARFWSHVTKSDGCWEWQASCYPNGYGATSRNQRSITAHRLAWELTNGPIPDGLQVLHECDNRRCVRPDHLFLGTHADNMADRQAKNRQAFGTRNAKYTMPRDGRPGAPKLTEDQVREIRAAVGESARDLATRYGVCRGTIDGIRARRRWAHLE